MEWREIASAPKDADILLWLPEDERVVVGFWLDERACWGTGSGGWGDDRYAADYPTHWMPVPAAPLVAVSA